MIDALKRHWPEYLMEAALLGLFMISASSFGMLLEHPHSSVRQALTSPFLRRVLMGCAMGLTSIALVYSPWGQQSGAHFNPSFTISFFRLGKIDAPDAIFYIAFQFAGGLLGLTLAAGLFRGGLGVQEVNYVATVPGMWGVVAAMTAEFAISFLLMTVVLRVSNTPRLARYTPWFVGGLVAAYIVIEAPISGTSMNPARSFAPALLAHRFDSLWIYFIAPPLGMLAAAGLYSRMGHRAVACAKLHHDNDKRCIFRCGYPSTGRPRVAA